QHKEAVEECTELKNSRAALKADQKLDLQEVEKQKKELQTRHDDAVVALETLRKEKDEKLKETVTELQVCANSLNALEKYDETDELLKATQRTVTNLENTNLERRAEAERRNNAKLLEASEARVNELKARLDGTSCVFYIADLKDARAATSTKNGETDQQLKEMEQKTSELQGTVDAVTLSLRQAEAQKGKLQKSYDEAKRAKTQALEKINKQLASANERLEKDLLQSEELACTLRSDAEALGVYQAELKNLKFTSSPKSQNATLAAKNVELKSLANPSPVVDPETHVSRAKLQDARVDLFTEQEKADRLVQEVADLEEDRERWAAECSMFMKTMKEYENDDMRMLQDELFKKNKEISRLKKRFDDSQKSDKRGQENQEQASHRNQANPLPPGSQSKDSSGRPQAGSSSPGSSNSQSFRQSFGDGSSHDQDGPRSSLPSGSNSS
ncbi:hypothetical protein BT96DRAFT_951856, partial [Gymnopus androsaceus JB14]